MKSCLAMTHKNVWFKRFYLHERYNKSTIHVGKYTIHGCYENSTLVRVTTVTASSLIPH